MCSKPVKCGDRAKVVLKGTVSDPHFSLLRSGKEGGEMLGMGVEQVDYPSGLIYCGGHGLGSSELQF